MLDRLNQIAKMVEEAIAAHPDSKKKKKPDEEQAADDILAEGDQDDKAARAERSVRKSMGGQKEPAY
jgi:hypothetical protein